MFASFSIFDLQVTMKVSKDTEQMTITELRKELAARNLSTAGKKTDLIQRLDEALREDKEVHVKEEGVDV